MNQLIPVVNKLQDVFGAIGQQAINLPQITVVGSQSSGKSSVLESIVGRDFLPRGSGVVTRRPLVLQLYNIGKEYEGDLQIDKSKGEEWGEFLHLPGQKFFKFDEIRAEIERETERVTGRNKAISNESINLKIFSPYVLNLTLVDLPGITKVPTGDQPENVEELVRDMCVQFISNPNAIILAVTAANSDLVNSEGLKLARSVDPEGFRTLGVLTKVDIMDQGTDCMDVLSNKVVPLQRGYIAVVNRSQRDIQERLPIRKGLAKEQAYFQSHPKYRQALPQCGTVNLARTLNHILMHHIRDCLPEIKSKINKLLTDVQNNLASLGGSMEDESNSAKGATLLKILSQFADNFCNKVDGKDTSSTTPDLSELYGGARISYIFNEVLGKRLRSLDPFEGLTDEDIRTAIANANGTRPSLFVPEISFDLLVRKQIARLEQPGIMCLDLVQEEVHKMIAQSETMELSRFPDLRDKVFEVVSSLLRACQKPAQQMISNLVLIELAYINTSHPDFVGGKAAVNAAQQSRKLNHQQQQQQQNLPATISTRDGRSTSGSGKMISDSLPQNGGTASDNGASDNVSVSSGTENRGFFGLFQSATGTPQRPNSVVNNGHHKPRGGAEVTSIRLSLVPEKMRCSANPSDKERIETEIIKTLISSYFEIVKKNFLDLVPKTIMRFLIMDFKERLQNELVSQLYKDQILTHLMRESADVAAKRKAYRDMRDLLERALEIVSEVKEFQPAL